MIVEKKKICGGCPTIKGTRITVSIVLANIRDGVTFNEICEDYHISKEDIMDCLDYAIYRLDKYDNR